MLIPDWNDDSSDELDEELEYDSHELANMASNPAICGGSFWGEVFRDLPCGGTSTNERLELRAERARREAVLCGAKEATVDVVALPRWLGEAPCDVDSVGSYDEDGPFETLSGERGESESCDETQDSFIGEADAGTSLSATNVVSRVVESRHAEEVGETYRAFDGRSQSFQKISDEPSDDGSYAEVAQFFTESDERSVHVAFRKLCAVATLETLLLFPVGIYAWFWILRLQKANAREDYVEAERAMTTAQKALWIGRTAILVLFMLVAATLVCWLVVGPTEDLHF